MSPHGRSGLELSITGGYWRDQRVVWCKARLRGYRRKAIRNADAARLAPPYRFVVRANAHHGNDERPVPSTAAPNSAGQVTAKTGVQKREYLKLYRFA